MNHIFDCWTTIQPEGEYANITICTSNNGHSDVHKIVLNKNDFMCFDKLICAHKMFKIKNRRKIYKAINEFVLSNTNTIHYIPLKFYENKIIVPGLDIDIQYEDTNIYYSIMYRTDGMVRITYEVYVT